MPSTEESGKSRSFLRENFEPKRVLISLSVAVPVSFMGSWLLRREVSEYDINPLLAVWMNWPLITATVFILNFYVTWRDRGIERREAVSRWILRSLAHTGVSYSLYGLLVGLGGMPYLTVNISLYCLGPMFFMYDNRKVFTHQRASRIAEPT